MPVRAGGGRSHVDQPVRTTCPTGQGGHSTAIPVRNTRHASGYAQPLAWHTGDSGPGLEPSLAAAVGAPVIHPIGPALGPAKAGQAPTLQNTAALCWAMSWERSSRFRRLRLIASYFPRGATSS